MGKLPEAGLIIPPVFPFMHLPFSVFLDMKKVLFLTYYWPPSGKASLHWPLSIIRYLPQFGIEPVVLTVENESFTQKDESLLSLISPSLKVFKSKAWEPFEMYKAFTGKKKNDQLVASETISTTNKSLTHRISIWIRMNLFIPDARVGWYFSAVKKGKEILSGDKFDAIVSIGPPHSTHLISRKLAKLFNIPFIPVFIDPWVDIAYYKEFKRNPVTLAVDNHLEHSIIRESGAVVFVTDSMRSDFISKYPECKSKSEVLYWGYNEESFEGLRKTEEHKDFKQIVHSGNIFDFQNPKELWRFLKKEIDRGNTYKIKFTGTVSPGIMQSIKENGLEPYTEFTGFLSYKEMLQAVVNGDYLLVGATEKRHVPGKLFEYLRSGNPVIAYGDDNPEVNSIIRKCNAGMMFSYDDSAEEFFKNTGSFNTEIEKVKEFDRVSIAEKLSTIIRNL